MAEKTFEDEFMEIQTGWISACLEALGKITVNKICCYASLEGWTYTADVFFVVGGNAVKKHDIGISKATEFALLDVLVDDTLKIDEVCQVYSQPCPTEIKMVFDTSDSSLDIKYRYEPITDRDPYSERSMDAEFEEWFAEIQQSLEPVAK